MNSVPTIDLNLKDGVSLQNYFTLVFCIPEDLLCKSFNYFLKIIFADKKYTNWILMSFSLSFLNQLVKGKVEVLLTFFIRSFIFSCI